MAIVQPTASKTEFRERILNAVQDMYSDVATRPATTFHFPTGRWACEFLGYPVDLLDAVPDTALESFAGVGYPFMANIIKSGDDILDIGSGSGTDMFIASLKAGSAGRICGLDMTTSMIDKANSNIAKSGFTNMNVVAGNAEALPWDDETFDVITSNGVLNLVPDKKAAIGELYRVLKTGGRFQISDIALRSEISEKCRMNPDLWAECIVGAVPEDQYLDLFRDAGFQEVQILERGNYFDRSPSEATRKSAQQFGAVSLTMTGKKENLHQSDISGKSLNSAVNGSIR